MSDMNISDGGKESMKSIQIITNMGMVLEAIIESDGNVTISVYSGKNTLAVASTTVQRLVDNDMLFDPAYTE